MTNDLEEIKILASEAKRQIEKAKILLESKRYGHTTTSRLTHGSWEVATK